MEKELLFVYGTLKSGGRFNHVLENSNMIHDFALVSGKIMDNGQYPFMSEEKGSFVHGEIYEVDHKTLSEIDQIEGFHKYGNDKHNLFVRKKSLALLGNNEHVLCWAYYGNQPEFDRIPIYCWSNTRGITMILSASKENV